MNQEQAKAMIKTLADTQSALAAFADAAEEQSKAEAELSAAETRLKTANAEEERRELESTAWLKSEKMRQDDIAHLKEYRTLSLVEQRSHNEKLRELYREGFAAIAQAIRETKP